MPCADEDSTRPVKMEVDYLSFAARGQSRTQASRF